MVTSWIFGLTPAVVLPPQDAVTPMSCRQHSEDEVVTEARLAGLSGVPPDPNSEEFPMRRSFTLASFAAAAAAIASLTFPAVAGADGASPGGVHHSSTVYVQTNDPTGNQIVAYNSDGRGLHEVRRVDTGGLGVAIPGAVVDQLASQGGLVADPTDGLLVGVNGGSNTISVFHAFGPFVSRPHVVSSGGTLPVSVAVRGGLIYVLNGGGTGSIQGFYAGSLTPIPGSHQDLGLTPNLTPAFLHTPGQVGFSPDGRHVIVTTKANGSDIDVFNLTRTGSVAGPAVVNPSATPVPFGFTFDRAGRLVVTEAGSSALTTYVVGANGTLTTLASTPDGLAALCWVATNGTFFFGSNAGSATVTSYRIGASGAASIVADTTTDGGPVDLATSLDGRSLFVETGASDLVDAFAVQPNGTLVATGSATPELPGHAGLEGIAVGLPF